MNILIEKGLISEMQCGANFAYILSDNTAFLSTEYKVLQSHANDCFVRSMKMMFNGHIQLYYLTKSYKPLSSMMNSIGANEFLTIIKNLLLDVIEVQNNGFLSCQNVDISFDKIYVNQSTYKVSLVYLPLNKHVFDDTSAFENELRTSLIKLIAANQSISSPKVMQLSSDLQNGMYTIDDIQKRVGSEHIREEKKMQDGNNGDKELKDTGLLPKLKLIAMNAPAHFELTVPSNSPNPDFVIGKRDTNDGVISFNKMISRVHCKITNNGGQFWITDLQSANGTFVNRVRLQPNHPQPIKNGDVVRLADSDFQIVIG